MRKTIKILSLMLILLFVTRLSFGQYSNDVIKQGSEQDTIKTTELNEVVVVGGTNYQVQQIINPPKLYLNSARIVETSPGQLSPYLGPFTGNQVDQVINGIRTSNGLFRTGPNQYFGWVPMEFTKLISISDGGNIGGTIERKIGIEKSQMSGSYIGGINGFTQSVTYVGKKFSIGLNNINYGNTISPDSAFKHSSYNQKSIMSEVNWSDKQKTTIIFSQSNDLERTDKWNGGFRISGYQKPTVYTWELQRYIFLNHQIRLNKLFFNLGYQNSTENILDGNKKVISRLDSYSVNVEYKLTKSITLYSANTIEKIKYQNGLVDSVYYDNFTTTKQGIRWKGELGNLKIYTSFGFKNVKISGISPFNGFEYSAILGYKGIFTSYDYSLNAPSYLMIKQAITNGRGVQIPNPNLVQENARTIRVGYKYDKFYFDIYYKQLDDAFNTTEISTNVFRTDNIGKIIVKGATFSYSNDKIMNTKFGLNTKIDYVYGIKELAESTKEPVDKTVPIIGYLKVNYSKIWVECRYQPIDKLTSYADLNDVRQYLHNKGVRLVNIGYTSSFKKIDYTIMVYNLFNDVSRNWGSSVDLPLRSINLTIKYNL